MLDDTALTFYPYLAGPATWTCVPGTREEPIAPDTWLWAPHPLPSIDATLNDLNRIIEAGWQHVADVGEIHKHTELLYLSGQLGHTRTVHIAGTSNHQLSNHQVWASASDLEHVKRVPVALAFTVPADLAAHVTTSVVGVQTLSVIEALPPPQLGEVAMVATELEDLKGYRRYTIDQLSEVAQALQRTLADALRTLAGGDMGWVPVSGNLVTIAQGNYQRAKTHLQSLILGTRDKATREHLRNEITRLDAAHARYQAIQAARHGVSRETWLEMWEAIRQVAQLLAAGYWAAYQAAYQPAAPDAVADENENDAAPQAEAEAERRQRAPRAPRAALVVKDPLAVHVPSHIFAQGIMRSLLDGNDYTRYPDRGIAEYRGTLAKRKGEITITLEPGDGEGWDHVFNSLNMLGDEVVDTFVAHLALAIDTHGVENITAPMWVNTDDILRICQRKQSNRAYTPEQRAAVVEHQRIIARAHVRAIWPSGRKGREYRIDSAIWDVFGQAVGEYKTITGEPVWERRQVKIGEWAKLLPPLSKETAIMLRKVLEYHSQRERYAKRLGFYLTLQFRVNASKGGTVERTMGVLLEQAGIKPDLKHPGETRKAIEGALARLQADNVIGDYRLIVDSTPKGQEAREQIEQRGRGWWELYAG
ncbi:MAG: hypothetical protein IVW57_09180, partial [Ktedonobacterales bacterium]|nr:hypothetical protein [Ktedonobacterales bacterium]